MQERVTPQCRPSNKRRSLYRQIPALYFTIYIVGYSRDTGLTASEAWALADDRSTWSALPPTAGYARDGISRPSHRTRRRMSIGLLETAN